MGWSDYTNAENTAITPIYPFYKSLELSFNERIDFCRLHNIFGSTYIDEVVRGSNNMPDCQDLDIRLTQLLYYFGRVVDGSFLRWNEGIYTEIGEARIDSRSLSQGNLNDDYRGHNKYWRRWYEQVIRVLNLLLTIRGYDYVVYTATNFQFIAGS